MKIKYSGASNGKKPVKAAKYNDSDYSVEYELFTNGKSLDSTYTTEDEAYAAAYKYFDNGKVKSDIEIRKCFSNDTPTSNEFVDSEWYDTVSYTDYCKSNGINCARIKKSAKTNRKAVKAARKKYDTNKAINIFYESLENLNKFFKGTCIFRHTVGSVYMPDYAAYYEDDGYDFLKDLSELIKDNSSQAIMEWIEKYETNPLYLAVVNGTEDEYIQEHISGEDMNNIDPTVAEGFVDEWYNAFYNDCYKLGREVADSICSFLSYFSESVEEADGSYDYQNDFYEMQINYFGDKVVSSTNRKAVKASRRAIMAGPGAGYTIKWNLESIKSINSFNVTNVSEPDQYGLITAEADCDVDVTVEIVEAYSYYYGIDSPLNDVPAKMTKVKFEIDPEQWPEIGSLYDADVAFAEELLNNEIYDIVSNGEVMYGGGWTHSTWDGTLTDYDHDDLIEVKVTDEEIIQYVDDAVSGELDGAYEEVEESKRINSSCGRKAIKSSDGGWTTDELVDKMNNNYRKHKRNKQQKDAEKFKAFNKKYAKHGIEIKPTDDSNYGAYQVINKGTPMDRLDDFRDMERYADSLIETEEYVNSSRNRFNPSAKTPIKSSDFEFVYDEDDEDYDDGDLSGYYSYDDLTPEQQDYAVAHWSDFSKCANTIYDWFNDDAMDWYHEDIDRIAEEYSEKYGFTINTDKMYWQSGSQGPYPDHWRNSEVFDKMYLGTAGNLTDVDLSFEGGLTVEVYGDYYIGDQVAYGYSPSQLADNGANEQAVQIITNIAQGAQDFVDEAWKLIEDTCSSYPDEDYVRGIFEGNPNAFTFVVDENGDIEDIAK